ncbi:MAG: histidine kinase, partial [Fuerstiella sp.]|nr:histidine kinase [Fuerstiella sp.]
VPGYEKMTGINDTMQEFHVTGRAIEDYKFPTVSGKARFHSPPLPERVFAEYEFRLMTVRSEGQFNSVVYDEEALYRGQERRDVVLMNADDIRRIGLQVDQHVRVKSETGELRMLLVREYDVRAGNVLMYYPEANVLVPHSVDPLSKTPGFKSAKVTIHAERAVVA